MAVIYKITSPSGKIYIGQTINVKVRIAKYKSLNCKFQIKLYNSLLKYGFDNHKLEIIEECEIDLLNYKERYWQEYYNCVEKGLNCLYTKTNIKKSELSKETKQKMRLSKLGKKASLETKNKMSISASGRKHSEKTKEVFKNKTFSKITRDKIGIAISKPLIDLSNGVFYNSINDAANIYNIKRNTLSAMLTGQNKNRTNLIYA